jgi:hypothetical protein
MEVIDVAPTGGTCRRCGTACCNCARLCVPAKGGQRDICNRCYEATKKEVEP